MREKLHIAKFTNVYHPHVNGVVNSVSLFRRGLKELGHTVFVFCPESSGYEDKERYIFRYPALEIPTQKYPLTIPISPFADRLFPSLKADVFHANHPALLGHVARKKSQELSTPLVFTYHTRYREYAHYASLFPQDMVKDFIFHWLATFMEYCHHIVVPSESIRGMLETNYGIESGVSVIPTGVDLDRFGVSSQAQAREKLGLGHNLKIAVSSGRLAKEKNFELLLRAFARTDFDRLYILGEGSEREPLTELYTELGLKEKVHLVGLVPFEDIPTYLTAADLFLFTSLTETQGLVTLEAMASHLPVVAVDASGTRELVRHGETGFLTPPDAEAIASAVGELSNNARLRASMGAAGRKDSVHFGVACQAEKMVEAYRRAIESHKSNELIKPKAVPKTKLEEFLEQFAS